MKIIQPPSYKTTDMTPPPHRLLEMNQVLLLSLLFHKLPFLPPLNGHTLVLPGCPGGGIPLQDLPAGVPERAHHFLSPRSLSSPHSDNLWPGRCLQSRANPAFGGTGGQPQKREDGLLREDRDGVEPGGLWRPSSRMIALTPPLIHLFNKQLLGVAPCQALGGHWEETGRHSAFPNGAYGIREGPMDSETWSNQKPYGQDGAKSLPPQSQFPTCSHYPPPGAGGMVEWDHT